MRGWPGLAGLMAGLSLYLSGSAAAEPPNIVILYADDMGYGDLGVQNPESKIPTPNLDRLAAEGLRFTDAHSSSGICTPSRYALLTGRHHWRKFHGIVNAFGPSVFAADRLTLPEMLRAREYRTACIGKWHLGWDWAALRRPDAEADPRAGYAPDAFDWDKPIPDGPLAHGFDHYFGDDVPNFPPYGWIRDDRLVDAPTLPLQVTPEPDEGSAECRPGPMVAGWRLDAVMPRLMREAVAWIDGRKGRSEPFFLYLPFTSPHAPIVPAPEFRGRSGAGPYGDYVAQTDAAVGAVLAALERNRFTDRTLVLFTSDNGPEHYAYERTRRYEHRSTGPLRGLKRDLWEGGHRVPFIVRWPGKVVSGGVCPALVGQVDWMATVAAIVDFPLPVDAAEDSFDLLPLLRGEVSQVRDFHIHNTRAHEYAIRQGNWVLIDAPSGAVTRVPAWYDEANDYAPDDSPAALYDLREDLAQRRNLLAEHPARAAELRALLTRIREQGFSAPRLETGSR